MTHPDRYDLDLPPDDIDTRMSGSNHGAGNNPPRRCIMFPSRMLRSIAPILLPLLCASAVVAVMSASLAAEETPTCQGNALHCEFLASFHTYARLWDVMEKKGAPESLKTRMGGGPGSNGNMAGGGSRACGRILPCAL